MTGPLPDPAVLKGGGRYVVLHPGASVPARRPSAARSAAIAGALTAAGHRVLVTGSPGEAALAGEICGRAGAAHRGLVNLCGRTSLPMLAAVLAGADALVAPNTGAAHLAAAVGTPVVSLFAPVVPATRWAPYRVPTVLLGDQHAACAGSRARTCPVPGHPCLDQDRPGRGDRGDRRRSLAAAVSGSGPVRILIWHLHGSWLTSFVQGGHDYLVPVLPAAARTAWAAPGPGTGRLTSSRSPRSSWAPSRSTWLSRSGPASWRWPPPGSGGGPVTTCPPSTWNMTRRPGRRSAPGTRWRTRRAC